MFLEVSFLAFLNSCIISHKDTSDDLATVTPSRYISFKNYCDYTRTF